MITLKECWTGHNLNMLFTVDVQHKSPSLRWEQNSTLPLWSTEGERELHLNSGSILSFRDSIINSWKLEYENLTNTLTNLINPHLAKYLQPLSLWLWISLIDKIVYVYNMFQNRGVFHKGSFELVVQQLVATTHCQHLGFEHVFW